MSNKWFHLYQGVAQGVEYVEENSTTTETNFHLEGLNAFMVNVPGQANNIKLIKERDQVDFCGRPSLLSKNKIVCLAYRINEEEKIYSINELRHMSVAILGAIFGTAYAISSGWKWPVLIITLISACYAISFYWSFHARACLARAMQ